MAEMKEYKCPCCGGAIAFDSGLQKMKCPYCDTEFEMETLLGYDEDLNSDAVDEMYWNDDTDWYDAESDFLNAFICNSCGGEIIADENTAATTCPYCGNPVVMTGRVSGMKKPDLVIPFKLDKDAAKAALFKHFEKKRLLPKVFKDENHIDEIKGLYVPFWLFDTHANAGFRYKATRIRHWSDLSYNYTETSYYSVIRSGSLDFAAVPVDGSSKMPDELMESIEPFDLSAAVDFQTAYLAGYFADKYDIGAADLQERANDRIRRSTERSFANTVVGYASVTTESGSVRFSEGRIRYAFYPVWMLNTTWNGRKYTFVMNGQTGKFVGDLPVDKAASRKMFFLTAGAAAAVSMALSFLFYLL